MPVVVVPFRVALVADHLRQVRHQLAYQLQVIQRRDLRRQHLRVPRLLRHRSQVSRSLHRKNQRHKRTGQNKKAQIGRVCMKSLCMYGRCRLTMVDTIATMTHAKIKTTRKSTRRNANVATKIISLDDLKDGRINEEIQKAAAEVIADIQNTEKEPEKRRALIVRIDFDPTADRKGSNISVSVKTSLAAGRKISTMLWFEKKGSATIAHDEDPNQGKLIK